MPIYKVLEKARWGAASQAVNRVPLGMAELLTLRAECSLVALKSGHSSRLLPLHPGVVFVCTGLVQTKITTLIL